MNIFRNVISFFVHKIYSFSSESSIGDNDFAFTPVAKLDKQLRVPCQLVNLKNDA